MGHVQDFKSGGNLVAHIHVGTTYHSRKEVPTLWVLDIFKSLSSFRQCPHFEHFISMVRPAVRTNPSRIRSFSKALFKPAEFETAGFRFRVNGKKFENEAFRKPWCYDNHVISLTEFSSSTNLKWLVIVMFLNFSGSVDEKHLTRFKYPLSLTMMHRGQTTESWTTKQPFLCETLTREEIRIHRVIYCWC